MWVVDGKRNNPDAYSSFSLERLLHFNADGTFIAQVGSQGSGPGQFFSSPYGLSSYSTGYMAIAPDGSLWVVDGGNYRLQHFNAQGHFIASVGSAGSGPGQFVDRMGGIAIAADGSLWVTAIKLSINTEIQGKCSNLIDA